MNGRRTSDLQGDLTLLFVLALYAVLGVAVIAIIALRFAITVTTELFIVYEALAFACLMLSPGPPPGFLDPTTWDDTEACQAMRESLNNVQTTVQMEYDMRHLAQSESLMCTKGSSYTRFDERSRLGKQINLGIDQIEAHLDEIDQGINAQRAQMRARIPDWRGHTPLWITYSALRCAVRGSQGWFLIGLVVFYGLAALTPGPFWSLQKALYPDATTTWLFAPYTLAVLVCYGTLGVLYPVHARRIGRIVYDAPGAQAWKVIEDRWHPDSDVYTHFSPGWHAQQRD